MKDIKYYLELNYPITIDTFSEFDGRKRYIAEITDLPGCGAHGDTIEEALKELEDAKIGWLEVSLKRGLEIPEPVTEEQFSGKFLLRIPARLHKLLTVKANKAGQSLNQYIKYTLEKSLDQELMVSKFEGYLDRKFNELKDYMATTNNYITTSCYVPQYYIYKPVNVTAIQNGWALIDSDDTIKQEKFGSYGSEITVIPEDKEEDLFESNYARFTPRRT